MLSIGELFESVKNQRGEIHVIAENGRIELLSINGNMLVVEAAMMVVLDELAEANNKSLPEYLDDLKDTEEIGQASCKLK